MTHSFNSIVELGQNPCPTVNPYIVAEYRYHRRTSATGRNFAPYFPALHAFRLARGHFEQATVVLHERQRHKSLRIWCIDSVANPRFEAHCYQCRWIEHYEKVGLMLENYADKGWYADEDGRTIYRGAVFQLSLIHI